MNDGGMKEVEQKSTDQGATTLWSADIYSSKLELPTRTLSVKPRWNTKSGVIELPEYTE